MNNNLKNTKIAIIGLGYVGLPLAIEFSKKYPVIGFDSNEMRINEIKNGYDSTNEIDHKELALLNQLNVSFSPKSLLFGIPSSP